MVTNTEDQCKRAHMHNSHTCKTHMCTTHTSTNKELRYIKAWLNLSLTTICVIFLMLYLCTWKCERVLVCTQVKVHKCEFIWLHSRPRPLITWSCTVVDNMSVAGTKATIPEMLESTLEHEILHEGQVQCHLPDFILGSWKHICICSELTRKAFLGVWSKQFLPAWKIIVACCRFPRIKSYSTHGYLPTEDTTGLQ